MDQTGSVSIASTPTPSSNIKLRVDLSDLTFCNYAQVVVNTPPASTQGRYNWGTYSSSYFNVAQAASQNYGIYGQAGNAAPGFNYGVYGKLIGSNNGAGVFGASRSLGVIDTQGDWAGFFNGPVKITAFLYVYQTLYTSDSRLKKDITALTNSTFNKLSQLNSVSYKYKTKQELKNDGIIPADTSTVVEPDNIFINRTHYGLIAQDVQQVLPELVYTGEDGLLSIDYVSIIPLIIETIKEQNAKIEDLEMQINNCCKNPTNEQQLKMGENNTGGQQLNEHVISVDLAKAEQIILYQNEPNPFNGSTVIRYFIPENMQIEAFIIFYDSYGNDIKKVELKEAGAGKIEANAQNLAAGIYSYSLLVNGKVVDTKKMMKNK